MRAVDERTGKAAFTTCFGALGGLPMVLGRQVLLTARMPTGTAGGTGAAVSPVQSLHLLDLRTGPM